MTETAPPEGHHAEIQALKRQNDELQRSIADLKGDFTSRLIMSELKAEAVRAGIVDLDGLRLIDLKKARLGDDHTVEGAAALIETLKTNKPWLFTPASSSVAMPAPPALPASQKMATEMTDAEYKAARAHILKLYNR
jgi:hypothetical protein